jgi:plasmid stabilization system protein ParE
MTIRWTPTAARDLEYVRDYIAQETEDAAIATVERILAGIEALSRHPQCAAAAGCRGLASLLCRLPWPYIE